MKKKLLVFLITFFSSLIFLNKVNAQTCTSQYNLSYYGFESVENSSNYETIMENMLTYFENQNTYENYVIMYTTPNSSVQQIKMILFNGRGTIYWGNTTTLRWHSDNQNIQIYTASNIYDSSPSYSTSNNSTYSYVLWGTSYPPTYTNSIVFIDTNTTNFKYDDWDHATCLRSADNTYTELYGEVTMQIYGYNQTPEITFSSTSYTNSNNNIYKKQVTIDFGTIDNELYDYMYLNTKTNVWTTVYLTNSTSYSFDVYENYVIFAQVTDKQGNVVTNASYAITDIQDVLAINFEERKIYDDYGNLRKTDLQINYFSDNRSNYYYEYTNSYYYVNGNLTWLRVNENNSSVNIENVYNYLIYARIVDKNTNSVLLERSYFTTGIITTPKINFITDPVYTILNCDNNNNNCIKKIEGIKLKIDYGLIDLNKYTYQYTFENLLEEEYWENVTTFDETYTTVYVTDNILVIAQVIDKETNEVIDIATYQVTQIQDYSTDISISLKDILGKNKSSITNIFSDLWESLILYPRIHGYIILVITSSIIILVIKSMKK